MTPTIHNEAHFGDIAEVVIMPGDPLRAKYIAEKYLQNVECFNKVRNMFGYTGTYNGVKVSIMGSGMGMASMGIYAYELYKFYGVNKIIRIGTCGTSSEELALLDIVLAERSYTEGNFALSFTNIENHLVEANQRLNEEIVYMAMLKNIPVARGTVMTSDVFDLYTGTEGLYARLPNGLQCIANEMESFALFTVAKALDKQAACLLTVVDKTNGPSARNLSSDNREKALDDMAVLALETITSVFGEKKKGLFGLFK